MKIKKPICIKDGHILRFFTREKQKRRVKIAIYVCPQCMTIYQSTNGEQVKILQTE